ncbi:dethiobiotin synthase [Comamonas endophytica]|uniref:ATP-dependent dethiobiotin synthetase BioD n=1 Tax=Comamonas endophytica TaxID=2949090 RepID=A0ABY6GEJ6_9BURK|nr:MULTISPECIES: dethiobiotin synthase [unclassified Acidovorax]MCD2514269.1 dethiobiotin synthase [Acidovorax sp. D4N7]UYG53521.1 dethiobiotin synthase [Acidovorax sp. 5MLIR]
MMSCFVTGTDTGVGKTLSSCALLHALAEYHARVVGMKPVASGAEADGQGGWANEDSLALRAASTLRVDPAWDNPVLLPDPVSPHIAAQRANVRVTLAPILAAYGELRRQADAIVVEGAGGWQVPLSPDLRISDLAMALQLPVVLVVGLRLGCINHALLTADAIRASGLPLAGWIASRIDPGMREPEANMAYLRQHMGAPLLADIAWQARPDARTVSVQLPREWQ